MTALAEQMQAQYRQMQEQHQKEMRDLMMLVATKNVEAAKMKGEIDEQRQSNQQLFEEKKEQEMMKQAETLSLHQSQTFRNEIQEVEYVAEARRLELESEVRSERGCAELRSLKLQESRRLRTR